MSQIVQIFSAGFIASLITLFGNTILDYFKTKREHEFILRKEVYLKKIAVFEKTVSSWTMAYMALVGIAVNFKLIVIEDNQLPDEYHKAFFDSLSKNLDKVTESTLESSYAIGLYLDLDIDNENQVLEMVLSFNNNLGRINLLLLSDNKVEDVNKLMDELVDTSKNVRAKYLEMISGLRKELQNR